MSIPIVHHVREKSQSKGSARTLLLNLALYANDCCGVAWPSDATLYQDVNVSRQRIHELKNRLEDQGELVIVERPGATNLYCVAWQGKPLGGTARDTGHHDPCCPLRHPHRTAQATAPGANAPTTPEAREGSEIPDPLVTPGVSDAPDPQGSDVSDGGCQKVLTQKQEKTREKSPGRLRRLMAVAPRPGADAPRELTPPPPCVGYPRHGERPRYCHAHGYSHFGVGGS
jgi:hypothetical protein